MCVTIFSLFYIIKNVLFIITFYLLDRLFLLILKKRSGLFLVCYRFIVYFCCRINSVTYKVTEESRKKKKSDIVET